MFRVLISPDANAGVGACFTDRHGGVTPGDLGSLNLGRTDVDQVSHVEANFERVRRAIGGPTLVTLSQVHSSDVVVVDDSFLSGWGPRSHLGSPGGVAPLSSADAMVTTRADVALVIRVADCVPVLLADPTAGVLGAVHAGREGYLGGVVTHTVEAMRDLGAREIVAWVGPHICGRCYEVDEAMADRVASSHPQVVVASRWGTRALDLGAGVEQELVDQGVTAVRLDPCTLTTPELHSHRRDGADAGRFAGIIWRVSGVASTGVPGAAGTV
ncbi:polyphenol oxidase family protein [Aestuariimicrobium kwangyangense]|uniref:polyphenol oxidase family protein n=1 Tax=Aestuariimicrobium kwangyangense TaxID=396389 RepID=UPI0003B53631|nr:polyphenol oxidase family protein [Aestuariimicrobium kwangyangense]